MELNNLDLSEQSIVSLAHPFDRSLMKHVYFLVYKGIIVYVGMDSHYPSRIKQHISNKAFDSVYAIECAPEEVKDVESHYISKFKPFYNVSENKNPFIENGTYVRHQDVLLLNAGGRRGSSRKILYVNGNNIIDAFTSKQIGWIINKVGYIYDEGGNYQTTLFIKCSGGKAEFVSIPIKNKLFCNPDRKELELKTIYYDDIDNVYILYIYSKAKQYKPFWYTIQAKERGYTAEKWVIDIIDYLFSWHNVTMPDNKFAPISKNKNNYRAVPKESPSYRGDKSKEYEHYNCIDTRQEIKNFWRKKNGLK